MPASRRNFLRRSLALTGGLALPLTAKSASPLPLRPRPTPAANDRINLAVIGAGGMGRIDTEAALEIPGVQLVGACDLYDGNLERMRQTYGPELFTTRDHRELLARPDIDAVIIATPDHWHRQISVDALEAGKGVYCEKPMVHSIGEGEAVIAAQQRTGRAFQVGSQGMSSLGNEKARDLLADGAIGQLVYAEGFWARNSPTGAWQYPIPADAGPETIDWDRYVSNTTQRPFDPLRFFRWRNYRDYGTGMSGDLFVHLFSTLHFITGSLGPRQIQSTGGLRYWKDGREVPDVLLGMFDYGEQDGHPPFNLSLRCNFVDGTSGTTYLRLVGTEGAMDVTWTDVFLRTNTVSDPIDPYLQNQSGEGAVSTEKRKVMLPPKEMHYTAEEGYRGAHYDHFNNFFTAVRGGTPCVEDATFGYRAAAPALLCNDSYFNREVVHWDPLKMTRL